jgi:cell division topological specificity factor
MSLFSTLFGRRGPSSREIAKNRLQLVLVHDRVDLSPQKMQMLRDELINAISKYVEIDVEGMQVNVTQNNRHCRLTADIPVLAARPKR